MKQRGPILWKQTFNEVIMPNILLGKKSHKKIFLSPQSEDSTLKLLHFPLQKEFCCVFLKPFLYAQFQSPMSARWSSGLSKIIQEKVL